ncbi:hypothetical protein TcasGA2_TC032862 [Tribolium castaneum]|uniref:Uncharacterized protein n=1 Tax=Tribolium castaneum TaxID=7070 RepID=A0A139WJD7_TRICA|nr:hypothetical protein TcasGA2_TC032862 [Tribolium castaneum]
MSLKATLIKVSLLLAVLRFVHCLPLSPVIEGVVNDGVISSSIGCKPGYVYVRGLCKERAKNVQGQVDKKHAVSVISKSVN